MAATSSVKNIPIIVRYILNQITSLVRSPQGVKAIEWVQKNQPEIAKLIQQGMNLSDGVSLSIKLNTDSGLYSDKGKTLKTDLKSITKLKKKYDDAVKIYNNKKSQLDGKKGTVTPARKLFLQNEVPIAKSIMDKLKKRLDAKIVETDKESYNFSVLAIGIFSNYNKLNKKVN